MPERPSFGDKVNGIVRFIEDPCEAPWIVYLELAKEPLKNAILTWFTFGLADVMRGAFRPKGVRGRRHGRGRGKGGARAGKIGRALSRVPGIGDDVGNFIGKRLPGAHGLNQRHVSQGVKNMWFIDGVLQRGLWWWLVIGMTTDFLYEWTSLLQQSEFCKRTAQRGLYASGVTGGALAIQGWIAQAGMTEQRNYGGGSFSGTIAFMGAGKWNVAFALTMEQFGNPGPSAHESRLVNAITQQVIGFSGTDTVEKDGVSQTISTADVVGPVWVQVQAKISWAAARGVSADLFITGA